jgi:hypothetical protein
LLFISISGFAFSIIGAFLRFHIGFELFTPSFLLSISVIFSLISIFIVLIDLIKNPIKNKSMWIIPLLFVGNLVAIIYLINREAHLRRALKTKLKSRKIGILI